MADKIKIRRGLFADLPNLSEGEFGLVTDRGTVYIGTASGNNILINPVLVAEDGYTLDGYLYPAVDNVHGLGTPDKRWQSVSVGPGSIHIISRDTDPGYTSNTEFKIGVDSSSGKLQFKSGETSLLEMDPSTGVTLSGSAVASSETVDEHYRQHSDAIQTVVKSLDGYLAPTADGYLSIGSSSPVNRLEVFGSATIGTNLAGAEAPSDGLRVQGDLVLDSMHQFLTVYRTVSSTNTTSLAYNPFASANGGILSVLSSRGISFNLSTGVATIAKTGMYLITFDMYITATSDGQLSALDITVNGAIVWTARPYILAASDPKEASATIIYGLDAGNQVAVSLDPLTSNTLTAAGSTLNIMRIA